MQPETRIIDFTLSDRRRGRTGRRIRDHCRGRRLRSAMRGSPPAVRDLTRRPDTRRDDRQAQRDLSRLTARLEEIWAWSTRWKT